MKLPATLASLLTLLPAAALPAQEPDAIYHHGRILTMNDAQPGVEAVATKSGKILAAGSAAEVLKLKGSGTRMIDLEGRTLLPGFVDAHGHVMGGGIQALSANLLAPPDGNVRDIPGLQQTLKEWVAANQAAVDRIQLIVGFGYDNSQLAELRHPTREELDVVSKDIPVLIVHQSGHLAAVNSKALEIGGINAATPNPPGGVIQRQAGGQEPNGVVEESAFFPLLMKLLGRVGPDGSQAFIKAGTDLWARFGYTTAQDGRSSPGVVKAMQTFAANGGLKVDVVSYPDVLMDRDLIKNSVSREYQNRFRVAGAKLTIDGSPQGFTAWRDRPYYKPIGNYPPGYSGYPAATAEQVAGALDWAFENNIQILTHSNGEAASDQLIACIRASTDKHGAGDRRPVLIHGQFLREDQVDALNTLHIMPSLFPMHTYYWGDWHRENTVGPLLADNISPAGWCLKRGMKFSTHHDAPVAFPDSMRVLDATVTRRSRSGDIIGPAHRVEVMTALKAMTLWPAWQHFEENRKGSIEVGKLADFVILDKDPTAVPPDDLDQIRVVQTIKEDTVIFTLGEKQKTGAYRMPATQPESAFASTLRGMMQTQPGSNPAACSSCLCTTISLMAEAITTGTAR